MQSCDFIHQANTQTVYILKVTLTKPVQLSTILSWIKSFLFTLCLLYLSYTSTSTTTLGVPLYNVTHSKVESCKAWWNKHKHIFGLCLKPSSSSSEPNQVHVTALIAYKYNICAWFKGKKNVSNCNQTLFPQVSLKKGSWNKKTLIDYRGFVRWLCTSTSLACESWWAH